MEVSTKLVDQGRSRHIALFKSLSAYSDGPL